MDGQTSTYTDLTTLESDHVTLKAEHATLNSEHTTLQSEHATLVSEHSSLSSEHSSLASEHSTLQSEHVTLSSEHSTLVSEHAVIKAETDKIDNAAADGLDGVVGSAAYELEIIETHHHNTDVALGEHLSRNGEINCGQEDTVAPFISTCGNGMANGGDGIAYTPGWGAPVCVVGTSDAPFRAGMVRYDPHRITIVDTDASKKIHLIQFIWGTGTVGDAILAGQTSSMHLAPEKDGKASPILALMGRRLSGIDKLWLRHWVFNDNAKDMDFFVSLHEYKG